MTAIAPEPVAKHMQLYPALDAATEAALRASIQRFGVLVPVTKDQHGRILDGHHRVRIATALGVDYGTRVRKVASESEARELARTLNEDRRHISVFERRENVEALKIEGHSNVAIGKALGVAEGTVRRDLQSEELRSSTKLPERTVGLDGKSRPAKQPKPKAKGNAVDTSTNGGRQRAEAAKLRVEKAVGNCNAMARGLNELRVEWASQLVGPNEIKGWDASFRDAVGALKKLRSRLKEVSQ